MLDQAESGEFPVARAGVGHEGGGPLPEAAIRRWVEGPNAKLTVTLVTPRTWNVVRGKFTHVVVYCELT